MKVLTTGMGWIENQPGGLNRYFADYTRALKLMGHEEKGLVVGPSGSDINSSEVDITNVMKEFDSNSLYSRMKMFRLHSYNTIQSFRPDVFNPHFALYVTLVGRSIIPDNVPIITHFHGPWALESKVEEKKLPKVLRETRYLIKKQVEKVAYRRSDSFIVLSDYFKSILMDNYAIKGERINVVPGAVDHDRFKPHPDRERLRMRLGIKPSETLLFCVRRLVRRMGIDRLITAMTSIVKYRPEVRLYIAGDGFMREEYSNLIGKSGLSSQITLLGKVSNDELVEYFQAADFSIVPTITLEGFGLVTVESLACGTPVLGTPYGGTREILTKFSKELLFSEGSSEAIAHKVIAVLNGDVQLPSREECRNHVLQHYTWNRVAESVTNIFSEEVLKRKRRTV